MVTDSTAATVVATCNAAGTAWEANGASVTKVACTIRKRFRFTWPVKLESEGGKSEKLEEFSACKRCDAASLKITQSFLGMTSTTGATIDRTGTCATWNLVCTGPSKQSWEV